MFYCSTEHKIEIMQLQIGLTTHAINETILEQIVSDFLIDTNPLALESLTWKSLKYKYDSNELTLLFFVMA